MITFWLVAATMIVVALFLLLFPLLRRPGAPAPQDHENPNAAIYRQRVGELEADRDSGALGEEQFEQARLELERALLSDVQPAPETPKRPASTSRSLVAAMIALVAVPVVAVGLYSYLGRTDLFASVSPEQLMKSQNKHSLDLVVNHLVSHVRSHPDDLRGWTLLARSYMALNRFNDAQLAYRKALRLDSQNPKLMVDYAEAQAMTNGQDLSGQPKQLLESALKLDPSNRKGLWLAGIAEFGDGNFQAAVDYWRRLKDQLPASSDQAAMVQKNIDKALAQAGGAPGPGGAQGAPAKVTVKVSVDPKLVQALDPNTTVFIFAKASNGPPMPLAIVRKRVGDLPVTVTLDDTMAMAPQARLSRFSEIQLVARVSQSGSAMAQSGDLQGSTGPVKVGAEGVQEVVIDSKVP